MSILATGRRASGIVDRLHPVAKLAALAIVTIVLLLSIDPVSAGVVLVLTVVLALAARVSWHDILLPLVPIAGAALLAAITTTLYGRTSGTVFVEWGILRISEGSLALGLAIFLRVLAITLPSVILLATMDPTDLADGLAQNLRLPARFVLGGLAGLRLVGLLLSDWRELELARRARGIADAGRLRRLAGQAFALFVLAIRRATKLATAMEARGFGAPVRRTWARESVLTRRDAGLVLIAAAVALLAFAAAVFAGTWRFVLGL